MTGACLVTPARVHLSDYCAALRRGWSPNNLRPEAGLEELAEIEADADAFLARLDDPSGRGAPVKLPDGSTVPRLPSLRRWIRQDGFCGSIGLRWQAGTADLPPYCSGHIGYAVVPWRRRAGLARIALAAILPTARGLGLPHVELTVDPGNSASIRVIEANGGSLVARRARHVSHDGGEELLYRISLVSQRPTP